MSKSLFCAFALVATAGLASANPVTNPNDPRSWQGANVGTFATVVYGSDTPANRQLVVDNQLLDDSYFHQNNYQSATLLRNAWSDTPGVGGVHGYSADVTGTGGYDYGDSGQDLFTVANSVDNLWFQTSGVVGETVFDLGTASQYAAVCPVIDHGPLPYEALESSIFMSDSPTGPWTPASLKLVFLEGVFANTGIEWDGFTYVMQPDNGGSFRYLSIIHGSPIWNDGDNEINAVLGLPVVPAPATGLVLGVAALASRRRR